MARPRSVTDDEVFELFYHLNDSPYPKSTRQIAREVLNGKITFVRVSQLAKEMREHFVANDTYWEAYQDWKSGKKKRRALYQKLPNGDISSDFKEVTGFVHAANARRLRGLKQTLKDADKVYRTLGYKRPQNWTADDINQVISQVKSDHTRYSLLVSIRRIAPHLKSDPEAPKPSYYKHVRVKRYELFTAEIEKALLCLEEKGMRIPATIVRSHLVLGCREGSEVHQNELRAGLLGVLWKNVSLEKAAADVFEAKSRKGILWRGCLLDLFGWDTVQRLKEIQGRTIEFRIRDQICKLDSTERVFGISYPTLTKIYDEFEKTLRDLWPAKRFDDITPHTARHLHVNLLFERNIPLEWIAGDAETGDGPFGVGWSDFATLKKYYFTLSQDSFFFHALRQAARSLDPADARRAISNLRMSANRTL